MMHEFLFLAGGDNLVHVIPWGNLQSNGSSRAEKKSSGCFFWPGMDAISGEQGNDIGQCLK